MTQSSVLWTRLPGNAQLDETAEALRARRNRERHRAHLDRLHSHLCAKASEMYRVAMMRECSLRLAKKLIGTAERRQARAETIRRLSQALWCAEQDQATIPAMRV